MTTARRRLLLAGLAAPWIAPPVRALDAPVGPVVLTLRGRGIGSSNGVDQASFDMAMLERLPQQRIVTQTPWYNKPRAFTGPLLRAVLAAAGAPGGEKARLVALNDYRVEMPLADVREHDVIVARLLDDKPMSVREKGPLFVMYPFDREPQLRNSQYFSRCVWQLRTIELL
ncbi:MAG TPA: hypothetical protein VM845_02590 [Burkholderiaceae bacterium]|jgi:hypothetical protein|nr:hypothetical protein [Burkholderiaceae bacterium]